MAMSIKNVFSRGIVDKFKDVVDINKLTLKISGKKSEIGKLKAKLGDIVYAKSQEGFTFPEEVVEVLSTIKAVEKEILELENQIITLKTSVKTSKTPKCSKCGIENAADAKFCKKCGIKLETQIEQQACEPTEKKSICSQCGTENEAGGKFCKECGGNLAEPPKATSPEEPSVEEKQSAQEEQTEDSNSSQNAE